jgi:Zn finger protein HypA/HybF involved in hydrogenase expression
MSSTQYVLSAIERPRCSRCQTRMMLERISSGPIGFEQRLFECPKCDQVEINVTASDPMESRAAGWLVGELRSPT